MYEGFYEKSSGYAMAAGMLLSAMSLLMQMTIRYRRMRGQKAQRRNRSIQGTLKAEEDMSARHPSGWKMIKGL